MSVDDPHTNHNENRCMYTVEEVQSEPGLIDSFITSEYYDEKGESRGEKMSR